jgi:hypothetical protein
LTCEASQLSGTDVLSSLEGVRVPISAGRFRGLEPYLPEQINAPRSTEGGGFTADAVTLSQDMTTLSLSVNVHPIQGVGQLRVLVLSKD